MEDGYFYAVFGGELGSETTTEQQRYGTRKPP
jgi:hypothetical protein